MWYIKEIEYMKSQFIFISLCLCLVSLLSCDEESQYSHREEIISQKIWEEDSASISRIFHLDSLPVFPSPLTDTLTTDSVASMPVISR